MIVVGMAIFFSGVVTGKLLLLPGITSHPGLGNKRTWKWRRLAGEKGSGGGFIIEIHETFKQEKFQGKNDVGKITILMQGLEKRE